jgi:aldehyde dehydrogenase (NAD+)
MSSTASSSSRRRARRCRSPSRPPAPRSDAWRRAARRISSGPSLPPGGRSRTVAGAILAPLDKERRLRRLAELFADHGAVFSDLDTLDAGLLKGYTEADRAVRRAGLDYYSGWPSKISGTIPATSPDVAVYVTREPIGVVGIIVPVERPGLRDQLRRRRPGVRELGGAEAGGADAVVGHAHGQLCQEAGIPPGVVNVVHGTGRGDRRRPRRPPGVDAIGFTGSVDTGRRIQAAAAARLKKVALELGGKSAHVFFDDCDFEPAAATAAAAVWGASGQVCTAGTRVLVQRGSTRTSSRR